jgi:hypothetical protein
MEINWTTLAYIFIGIFAMSGFFKGWWKEAITTILLLFLVFLSYFPAVAEHFINLINLLFATLTRLLPDPVRANWQDLLKTSLQIETVNGAIQLKAGDGGTWLVILLLFIGLAIFLGRALLPNNFREGMTEIYRPKLGASLVGALLGAFNGFIILRLVTEYLYERQLPGVAGAMANLPPRSESVVQAIAVPATTLTDSMTPWIIVGLGLLVILAAIRNRIQIEKDKEGYRRVIYKSPLGHKKFDITLK